MTSDIWTSSFIQDLSDEDIQSFQEIVVKDTKNISCTSDEKSILHNNLDLWLFCLRNLRKENELKLAHRKVNLRSQVLELKSRGASQEEIDQVIIDSDKARNATIKFTIAVERKMLYVKMILQQED